MPDLKAHSLLATEAVAVFDVLCSGKHRPPDTEECTMTTRFVFPYRGIYVHHVGRTDSVAESNRVVFINADEPFRVSHPLEGGDATLSISLSAPTLLETVPTELQRRGSLPAVNRSSLRVEAQVQVLAATLRHRLVRGAVTVLEAEAMTLALIRRAVGHHPTTSARITTRSRRLVENTKVVLAADLERRRGLSEIAREVGVSPVYLTQVFQRVEGVPLYRYQLQQRLARSLHLLGQYDDVTDMAHALGFSSHSHFSARFKQAYGQTPSDFRRLSHLR